MSKYTESTYIGWTKPVSETEDSKINNAISMVKSAINSHNELSSLDIEVFVQGSYGNNTNVKGDSDVDVCTMLKSTVFTNFRDGIDKSQYNYTEGTISYSQYKSFIKEAQINKFGRDNVSFGNKSIKISSNSYHVDADVVPAFQYRDFSNDYSFDPTNYVEGIKFFADDGTEVTNFPKLHIKNGVQKNIDTNHQYKKLVRIFKRLRNIMVDNDLISKDRITSFLVESLIWNVPNRIITNYSTWDDTIKNTIIHLYNETKSNATCDKWGEVSEKLYLFYADRKWTIKDANDFILHAWRYLEYDND